MAPEVLARRLWTGFLALVWAASNVRLLDESDLFWHAALGRDLDANDQRQDYLRSQVERREDGALIATPFAKQDSSMLRLLAEAGGLVVRPPHAPPARTGDTVLLHLLG